MSLKALIKDNTILLEQDKQLLLELPPHMYTVSHQPHGSTLGEQFRHIIRRYEDIIAGRGANLIDYTQPERLKPNYTKPTHVNQLEVDQTYAITTLTNLQQQITLITEDTPLSIIETTAEEKRVTLASTLSRELATVANHTVHHHAIISLLLFQKNYDLEKHLAQGYSMNPTTQFAKKYNA